MSNKYLHDLLIKLGYQATANSYTNMRGTVVTARIQDDEMKVQVMYDGSTITANLSKHPVDFSHAEQCYIANFIGGLTHVMAKRGCQNQQSEPIRFELIDGYTVMVSPYEGEYLAFFVQVTDVSASGASAEGAIAALSELYHNSGELRQWVQARGYRTSEVHAIATDALAPTTTRTVLGMTCMLPSSAQVFEYAEQNYAVAAYVADGDTYMCFILGKGYDMSKLHISRVRNSERVYVCVGDTKYIANLAERDKLLFAGVARGTVQAILDDMCRMADDYVTYNAFIGGAAGEGNAVEVLCHFDYVAATEQGEKDRLAILQREATGAELAMGASKLDKQIVSNILASAGLADNAQEGR